VIHSSQGSRDLAVGAAGKPFTQIVGRLGNLERATYNRD
jgi:hypothetical protein